MSDGTSRVIWFKTDVDTSGMKSAADNILKLLGNLNKDVAKEVSKIQSTIESAFDPLNKTMSALGSNLNAALNVNTSKATAGFDQFGSAIKESFKGINKDIERIDATIRQIDMSRLEKVADNFSQKLAKAKEQLQRFQEQAKKIDINADDGAQKQADALAKVAKAQTKVDKLEQGSQKLEGFIATRKAAEAVADAQKKADDAKKKADKEALAAADDLQKKLSKAFDEVNKEANKVETTLKQMSMSKLDKEADDYAQSIKKANDLLTQLKAQSAAVTLDAKQQLEVNQKIANTEQRILDLQNAQAAVVAKKASGAGAGALPNTTKTSDANANAQKRVNFILDDTTRLVRNLKTDLADLGRTVMQTFQMFATVVSVPTQAFGDFQKQMLTIKQLATDFTAKELTQFEETAKRVAVTNGIMATEIAKSGIELVRLGLNAKETNMVLSQVADAALANGIAIDKAAAIGLGTTKAFGLGVKDLSVVLDVLTRAAVSSATDIEGLGQTFKYAGPIFRSADQDIKQLGIATAILSNNMIRNSQAGTTLRSMMVNLQKPTKEANAVLQELGIKTVDESTGKIKPFMTIVQELSKAMQGLATDQKNAALAMLFGKYALSGSTALINSTTEEVNKATAAFNDNALSAKKMADGMRTGVNFSLDQMRASVNLAAIELGEKMANSFQSVTNAVTQLAIAFQQLPDGQQQLIADSIVMTGQIVAATTAIGALILALNTVAGFITSGWAIASASFLAGIASIIQLVTTLSTSAAILFSGLSAGGAVVVGVTGTIGLFAAALWSLSVIIERVGSLWGAMMAELAEERAWETAAQGQANLTARIREGNVQLREAIANEKRLKDLRAGGTGAADYTVAPETPQTAEELRSGAGVAARVGDTKRQKQLAGLANARQNFDKLNQDVQQLSASLPSYDANDPQRQQIKSMIQDKIKQMESEYKLLKDANQLTAVEIQTKKGAINAQKKQLASVQQATKAQTDILSRINQRFSEIDRLIEADYQKERKNAPATGGGLQGVLAETAIGFAANTKAALEFQRSVQSIGPSCAMTVTKMLKLSGVTRDFTKELGFSGALVYDWTDKLIKSGMAVRVAIQDIKAGDLAVVENRRAALGHIGVAISDTEAIHAGSGGRWGVRQLAQRGSIRSVFEHHRAMRSAGGQVFGLRFTDQAYTEDAKQRLARGEIAGGLRDIKGNIIRRYIALLEEERKKYKQGSDEFEAYTKKIEELRNKAADAENDAEQKRIQARKEALKQMQDLYAQTEERIMAMEQDMAAKRAKLQHKEMEFNLQALEEDAAREKQAIIDKFAEHVEYAKLIEQLERKTAKRREQIIFESEMRLTEMLKQQEHERAKRRLTSEQRSLYDLQKQIADAQAELANLPQEKIPTLFDPGKDSRTPNLPPILQNVPELLSNKNVSSIYDDPNWRDKKEYSQLDLVRNYVSENKDPNKDLEKNRQQLQKYITGLEEEQKILEAKADLDNLLFEQSKRQYDQNQLLDQLQLRVNSGLSSQNELDKMIIYNNQKIASDAQAEIDFINTRLKQYLSEQEYVNMLRSAQEKLNKAKKENYETDRKYSIQFGQILSEQYIGVIDATEARAKKIDVLNQKLKDMAIDPAIDALRKEAGKESIKASQEYNQTLEERNKLLLEQAIETQNLDEIIGAYILKTYKVASLSQAIIGDFNGVKVTGEDLTKALPALGSAFAAVGEAMSKINPVIDSVMNGFNSVMNITIKFMSANPVMIIAGVIEAAALMMSVVKDITSAMDETSQKNIEFAQSLAEVEEKARRARIELSYLNGLLNEYQKRDLERKSDVTRMEDDLRILEMQRKQLESQANQVVGSLLSLTFPGQIADIINLNAKLEAPTKLNEINNQIQELTDNLEVLRAQSGKDALADAVAQTRLQGDEAIRLAQVKAEATSQATDDVIAEQDRLFAETLRRHQDELKAATEQGLDLSVIYERQYQEWFNMQAKFADERLAATKADNRKLIDAEIDLQASLAALTPDKEDDIKLNAKKQRKELEDQYEELLSLKSSKENFALYTTYLNEYNAKLAKIDKDELVGLEENEANKRQAYRETLLLEAQNSGDRRKILEQETKNQLGALEDWKKGLEAAGEYTVDKQREYAAKRVEIERKAADQIKQFAVDQFNELKTIRQQILETQSKQYEQNILKQEQFLLRLNKERDDLQREIEYYDAQIAKLRGEFDEQDKGLFQQMLSGVNLPDEIRKGLEFIANPTGVPNTRFSRQTQREAIKEQIDLLRQRNQNALDLEEISSEQYWTEESRIASIQGAAANAMLTDSTIVAKLTAKEKLEIQTELADAYKRFQEAELKQIEDKYIAEKTANEKRLANLRLDEIERTKIIDDNKYELDLLKQQYDKDINSIDLAMDKLNNSHKDLVFNLQDVQKNLGNMSPILNKITAEWQNLNKAMSGAKTSVGTSNTTSGMQAPSGGAPIPVVPGQTAPEGYNVTDGNYWYQTTSDMLGLKDGGILGMIPDQDKYRGDKFPIMPGVNGDAGELLVSPLDRLRDLMPSSNNFSIMVTGNVFQDDVDFERVMRNVFKEQNMRNSMSSGQFYSNLRR